MRRVTVWQFDNRLDSYRCAVFDQNVLGIRPDNNPRSTPVSVLKIGAQCTLFSRIATTIAAEAAVLAVLYITWNCIDRIAKCFRAPFKGGVLRVGLRLV